MTNSIVIRHTGDIHELVISSGIYDLRPIGIHDKQSRVTATVNFIGLQHILFQTEEELLAYRAN